MSDADIQQGLRLGERAACEALVRRHHERIYRLLWADTGSAEDAQDLTQETFLAVWRKPDRAAKAENLEAWLCGVALKQARSLRRRVLRRKSISEAVSPPTPVDFPSTTQLLDQAELLDAVRDLPAKYRHPLLLHALHGLSHREVAQALGISDDTARWRVSEARKRLRAQLEDEEEEQHVTCEAPAE
ncbi:MAG TPA: RNA polymerase sigma factor [Armatimonadota bacterium]|nr:RNA polymerase sigma factor [Armatimonadota bacterium]